MSNDPIEFPANPEVVPEKIRKNEDIDFEDGVKVWDRLRRVMEFNFGSPDQEDASTTGSVTVPANTTTTITIVPEDNTNFYLSEVAVNPDDDGINWTLEADDIETNSNTLYFDNPFTVRRKIQIEIENTTSNIKNLDYSTDARAVEAR